MEKILRKIEKLIPKRLYKLAQPIYHFSLAIVGTIIYGFPGKSMTTIGVTGTKGKTSTANFIYSVLKESGKKVGLISTANIKIGEVERVNKYHMSMPGRFILQKLLKEMKKANCKIVVLEVTSEGIKQFRHLGLFLNVSIFTNLSPEHLASHGGSFRKYRETKMRIFKRSFYNPIQEVILNSDDENAKYFENIAKQSNKVKITKYSLEQVSEIKESEHGVSFKYQHENYRLNILGKFNIYNSLPAILLGEEYRISKENIKKGLESLKLIPGRMEEIKCGQDFRVIVDYAHEKLSMTNLLGSAQSLKVDPENKIIVVLGGDGGGRDERRLTDMGEVVGKMADTVIVANSDPYYDNQLSLAKKIADVAIEEGKILNENLFIILDRGEAIKRAINLAKSNDIVLLTTRGSLTTMSVRGEKIKSDDRILARIAIGERLNNN